MKTVRLVFVEHATKIIAFNSEDRRNLGGKKPLEKRFSFESRMNVWPMIVFENEEI